MSNSLSFLIVGLLIASSCTRPTVESESGSTTISRVCSVSLAADEMLYGLGVEDRVVAVSRFSDNAGYSNVVGKYPSRVVRLTADLELIVRARPDLVVVSPYNSQDFLNVIDSVGLQTYRTEDVNSWEGISKSISGLADQLGVIDRARVMLKGCETRLNAVKRGRSTEQKLRVLVWSADTVTNGEDTSIGDMIERAGAINVARELGLVGMTQISAERVLRAEPDVLLLGSDDPLGMSALPPAYREFPEQHGIRVVTLPTRLLTSVSQFFVDGVELLAERLYGPIKKKAQNAEK